MTLTGQLRRQSLIYIILPAQLAHYSVFPDPYREQCYSSWPLTTGPTVLSPWHMSGASVRVTLTPGVSDENLGDGFGGELGFTDDQIWATRSDPVSASEKKKRYDSHA